MTTTTTKASGLVADGSGIIEALGNAGKMEQCIGEGERDHEHIGGSPAECARYWGSPAVERVAQQILFRDRRRKAGQMYGGVWGMMDIVEHWDARHTRKDAAKLLKDLGL